LLLQLLYFLFQALHALRNVGRGLRRGRIVLGLSPRWRRDKTYETEGDYL
jgi:hypothetical protein